jgi:hypothetical protein
MPQKGGSRFKSGLKIIVMGGTLLLEYAQVFSRGEGRIGGPNSPYGALGSPQKIYTTSQLKILTSDPREACRLLFLLLRQFLYAP